MPAPLDLTGREFGSLTVLRPDGRIKFGREQTAWLCRCACGVEVRVAQTRLTTKTPSHQIHACDACRSHPCEICGAPISASSAAKTCSAECLAEKDRRYQLDWYYAKRRDDPAEVEARRARGRAKWAAMTPEERSADIARGKMYLVPERTNALARAAYARRIEDPAYREKHREKSAAWAEANREKAKAYGREYRRRKRAEENAVEMGEFAERMRDDE